MRRIASIFQACFGVYVFCLSGFATINGQENLANKTSHEIKEAILKVDEREDIPEDLRRVLKCAGEVMYTIRCTAEGYFEGPPKNRSSFLRNDINDVLWEGESGTILETLKLDFEKKGPVDISTKERTSDWLLSAIKNDWSGVYVVTRKSRHAPECYQMSFSLLADRAIITRCVRDDAFDTYEYSCDRRRRETEEFIRKGVSQKSDERRNFVPIGGLRELEDKELDVGRISLLSKEENPVQMPPDRRYSVLLREKGQYDRIEQKFNLTVHDDGKIMSITKCERDEEFLKEATQRQKVSEFVAIFISGRPEDRAKMLAKDAKSILPSDGEIATIGRLNYECVRSAGPSTWECSIRMRHSGSFGINGLRKGILSFRYIIREDDNGEMRVISETTKND